MPSASVELAEIRGKVVFEEHPALARLGRLEPALAGVLAQDGRRHAQEPRRFLQVERAHGLPPVIVGHPDVVAACLRPGLAADEVAQAFGKLPRGVLEVVLEGV